MDYVVGGADSDHQMRILNSVETFDKLTHTWKPVNSMDTCRREPAAIMVPLEILTDALEVQQCGMLPQV